MHRTTTWRWQLRSVLGPLVLALASSGGLLPFAARSMRAQPPRERPMSTTMVRRIAEIVDGHRSGDTIFVAVGFDFPHAFRGAFPDREAARRAVGGDGSVGVFGPYVTRQEQPLFFIGCHHDGRGSMYMPPPEPICPPERLRVFRGNIEDFTLSLTIRRSDGTSETVPVPPRTDALFFTVAAMDKFYFPYYAKVFGADTIAVLHQRFIDRLGRP